MVEPQNDTRPIGLKGLLARGQDLSGCVLTIGNFDGVHVGHQQILGLLSRRADELGTCSVALTFEPHPVRFFRPEAAPFRLSNWTYRRALLAHYGVQHPLAIQFDELLSGLEPERFVNEVVIDAFSPAEVVIGYDFNFGKQRRGTPELLTALCRDAGVNVTVQAPVETDGQTVSSTLIREVLASGDIASARRFLGRPPVLFGEVVAGAGRGTGMGFPTANIKTEGLRLPASGVYACMLNWNQQTFKAITNIGHRPTFNETGVTIESFVFDDCAPGDLNLYGEHVSVHLINRLRDEMKFPDKNALISQIQEDLVQCKAVLEADSVRDLIPVPDP